MSPKFLYLLLIDLCGIHFNNSYAAYTKREPLFGPCMINAYLTAFNKAQPTKILSHDLLKSIHKEAMIWHFDSGGYKKKHNFFSSYPAIVQENSKLINNLSYSFSEKGIFEFLDYWFINTPKPFHQLELFTIASGPNQDLIIQDYCHQQRLFLCLKKNKEDDLKADDFKFIKADDLKENIKDRLKTNRTALSLFTFLLSSSEQLAKKTTEVLTVIFNQYNKKIKECRTDDEIIRTIVEHVQRINQVHPFQDGNIRTCYILINKLLHDHGLGLTLLMNPNRLDFCSVEELVSMVKEGQAWFRQILPHSAGSDSSKPLELQTNDKVGKLRSIVCNPEKMDNVENQVINDFIQRVVLANFEKTAICRLLKPPLSNPSYGFFSKHEPIDSGIIDEEKSRLNSRP